MNPLTLEDICMKEIIDSVPYNEIEKLPIFLQNKLSTFEDSLFISKYKPRCPVYDNYFEEGTEEYYMYDKYYYKYIDDDSDDYYEYDDYIAYDDYDDWMLSLLQD